MDLRVEGRFLVVIDSTALRSRNGQLNLAPLEILSKTAPTVGAIVSLPSVVLEELKRAGVTELDEARSAIARANKTITKFGFEPLPTAKLERQPSRETVEDVVSRSLKEWGVSILNLPSASHAEIVARDLARTKPFNADGRGYRDTLVWLSLLERALAEEDRGDGFQLVYLVSENTADFAGPDGRIHPSLGSEAVSRARTGVELVPNVHILIEKHLGPRLEPVRGLVGQPVSVCFPSAREVLAKGLEELLEGLEYLREIAGPSAGDDQIVLRELIELKDIVWARQLDKGQVMIEFSSDCKLYVASIIEPRPPKRKSTWKYRSGTMTIIARAVISEEGEFIAGAFLPIEPSAFELGPASQADLELIARHSDITLSELMRDIAE